jgi:type IV secretion system protein VirB3
MNEQPRTIPIHVSLIRPILLMGAERELVLISAIIAAVLVMSLERPLFAVVGVVFWALTVASLQRAAKNDPLLSRVYLRHARYRAYYAAQSRATSRVSSAREGMPC